MSILKIAVFVIVLPFLILVLAIDCLAALPQQPSGLKFKDGWMLKWGASMEDVASHFGKTTSVTLNDLRKRSFDKDASGMDKDHAIWNEAASEWQYVSLIDMPTQVNPMSINCVLDDRGGVCWGSSDLIAEPYAKASMAFDHEDRFNTVELEFAPDAFDLIVGMLMPVWGKPQNTEIDNMQNVTGAQFQQKITQWTIDDVSAKLRKYGDADSTEISFGSLSMTFLPLAPPTRKLQPHNPF